jgi:hypothetical protein
MGADLYRNTTTDADRQSAIKQLDQDYEMQGMHTNEAIRRAFWQRWDSIRNDANWYFRDSYNDSSLMWKIGLSWWQDLDPYMGPAGDGVLGKDEDGEDDYSMHPPGIRRFVQEIRNRSELLMFNCRDLDQEEKEYFSDKYDRFLIFLDATADAGDTISCSV